MRLYFLAGFGAVLMVLMAGTVAVDRVRRWWRERT